MFRLEILNIFFWLFSNHLNDYVSLLPGSCYSKVSVPLLEYNFWLLYPPLTNVVNKGIYDPIGSNNPPSTEYAVKSRKPRKYWQHYLTTRVPRHISTTRSAAPRVTSWIFIDHCGRIVCPANARCAPFVYERWNDVLINIYGRHIMAL